ncbi:uncharacterized protein LOC129755988 [Uranotaenia lowii]|uniref:uncharacterized protein LOC129755988 n=1 Tax=Uranotaenia lowii TaxID=190385 RepID=UPI00247A3189|nr:uncharacterized protein LOC129755988 [Uranotaenia lowii]
MEPQIFINSTSPEVTGFRCGECGGFFRRQHLLRLHEQKSHGANKSSQPPVKSITINKTEHLAPGFLIPAFHTNALQVARSRQEIPFAVLYKSNEIPLIVRVIEKGASTLLKAAEKADFLEAQQRTGRGKSSYVIAVVAIIHERVSENGTTVFMISGPIPGDQQKQQQQGSTPKATGEFENRMLMDAGNENLHKTLAQLNAPEVEFLDGKRFPNKETELPKASRPHQAPGPRPSTSGINTLKRKSKDPARSALPPKRAPLVQQPKVIAVVDEAIWYGPQQKTNTQILPAIGKSSQQRSVKERNFQNIATTGPLLSPVKSDPPIAAAKPPVSVVKEEDPFASLDLMELFPLEGGGGQIPEPVFFDDSIIEFIGPEEDNILEIM